MQNGRERGAEWRGEYGWNGEEIMGGMEGRVGAKWRGVGEADTGRKEGQLSEIDSVIPSVDGSNLLHVFGLQCLHF